ncbi:heptaprenylglyceryl phosphate synthase [Salipaludibacillus agaradhaerens]|jgi:putative glycerol-1-phosphate prenyltransferase|uniref:Heptaprenylglyceryl phosphate synthase n=1 Tax=Salipaludibacillus agaradhaerens TaxID=76935 RepID=A0A9Q4B3Y6_SALAG|nr:heptaprenylglyceryl phosphate synthase [Salipaludibacillus agaradhaerens]MCR6097572.1 heptaprenylglyceryl phosphate synthase [Salipaludibacillus agaradhaerens]MCR6112944.1 heptaprenylglyceryl phosphate synthase [Salipaludibacillus agaradhaerens]
MKAYHEWRHVFKLDPAKPIDETALEQLCESGTDAIIIGGSDNITEENTLDLLMRVRRYSVACALEVSTLNAVVPGFDYFLIPSVLNTRNTTWLNGLHHRALKEFGHMMNFEEVLSEGYCVLNKNSKVAQVTEAETDLGKDDVVAYARMTDQLFHMPIFYLEYSGTYGDPDTVQEVNHILEKSQLFYGGGITSVEQAEEMAERADTIVVGNVIYTDLKTALKTVHAVKKQVDERQ